jgi:hypothetical protein
MRAGGKRRSGVRERPRDRAVDGSDEGHAGDAMRAAPAARPTSRRSHRSGAES